jgi:zinc protease
VARVPVAARGKTERIRCPSAQSHVLAGQPGMARADADYFPLYVGNFILGGSGLVSRLSDEIREKRGLSYSAYSYLNPMRVPGPFVLGLQTRNTQADAALKVMRETLMRFVETGPTEMELVAAKKNISGGFPLRLDSNRDILGYLAVIGFYDLPLDWLETYVPNVEAVTAESIRDAFRRRIRPAEMVTVVVGGDGKGDKAKAGKGR